MACNGYKRAIGGKLLCNNYSCRGDRRHLKCCSYAFCNVLHDTRQHHVARVVLLLALQVLLNETQPQKGSSSNHLRMRAALKATDGIVKALWTIWMSQESLAMEIFIKGTVQWLLHIQSIFQEVRMLTGLACKED
jgi:hypothetical protein